MTDIEPQKQPKNFNDPKFENWILRDAWNGFFYNLPIILLAIIAMVGLEFVLANFQPAQVVSVSKDGFTLRVEQPMGLVVFPVAIAFTVPFAVLMYSVHSFILIGAPCWFAFSKESRGMFFPFLNRMVIMVLALTAEIVFWQHLLWVNVSQGLVQGSQELPVYIVAIAAVSIFATLVLGVLFVTWPVSIMQGGKSSARRALARGKKTFWYIVGKNLLVLPVLLIIQLITFSIATPIIKGMILQLGAGEFAGTPEERIIFFVCLRVLVAFITAFWCCVEGSIISRGLLIGEARLNGSSGKLDTEKVSVKGNV
ncbi:hypothetical protein ACTU44_16180 [Thalassospira sp. SM2505]